MRSPATSPKRTSAPSRYRARAKGVSRSRDIVVMDSPPGIVVSARAERIGLHHPTRPALAEFQPWPCLAYGLSRASLISSGTPSSVALGPSAAGNDSVIDIGMALLR